MIRVRAALSRLRAFRQAEAEKREAPAPRPPEEQGPPGPIWVVTPCKGRLTFVQQTLGRVMAHPDARCCIVDYRCPDHVGDWVEREFAGLVAAGRLVVERVDEGPLFNKCRAHNAGARRARRAGAEYLCFLDADTLVEPGFYDFIRSKARRDRFQIAALREDGSDMPSMTGLLVVHGEAFEGVGGFDEAFASWGAEDIELRVRLCLIGGLDFDDVPLSLTRPIPHDDRLRTRFYAEHDLLSSNTANMARIHAKLHGEWRGRMRKSPSAAARLWFKHGWYPSTYWAEPQAAPRAAIRPVQPDEPISGIPGYSGPYASRRVFGTRTRRL
jgi:hypothetical protein